MRNGQLFKSGDAGQWVSLVLRLAVGSLFFAAAVRKLKGGMETTQKTVGFFQTNFEKYVAASQAVDQKGRHR
jgi:uncharacterized membrane protein YphA (DoxX/SURF4 family)